MTIAITGATGHLGGLVVDALLDQGLSADDLVAVVRTPSKAARLAERGVEVREASYTDSGALEKALYGVDKLLLVSGSEIGQRAAQHANVIARAKAAGVGFIAYTSVLDALNSPIALAAEHRETEDLLAGSGIDFALLRNGWYWENYLPAVASARQTGTLLGSAGQGRVAAAARIDYALAAATVLLADDQAGKVYELGGDERLTYTELAAVISTVIDMPVAYVDLPETEYIAVLEGAGLPAPIAHTFADADTGIAAGALDTESGDLQMLIGRNSTPAAAVLSAAAS
ncbi:MULTISPECIES: SDR family oxidoreductase [Mycobacteriaceae]|uniref:SDR family oxidoreductase n=1 Tax=Mycobacteriaceae TaxID=1762 RepID=UPI0009A70A50|nr:MULTISPECIES: SDR family oxidoreductase [Mycobacteriaceae]MDX1880925.1 SDR family oxidoreductase [Mycolicibacterium sp. 141076]RIT45881.1 SDR family oxidoreductase [Mycobacteroides abscessus]RUP26742.1 MAG: SDR family oxidoreductase [Mycolicibacterium sp.]UCZ59363.1 SDR family oxidoreductase [Mycolicibacterium phocaicum]SKT75037.1 putative nucleoside-diphosphate sugar epimerase [Mycobacteroides abscessus subsp. massiliense]